NPATCRTIDDREPAPAEMATPALLRAGPDPPLAGHRPGMMGARWPGGIANLEGTRRLLGRRKTAGRLGRGRLWDVPPGASRGAYAAFPGPGVLCGMCGKGGSRWIRDWGAGRVR